MGCVVQEPVLLLDRREESGPWIPPEVSHAFQLCVMWVRSLQDSAAQACDSQVCVLPFKLWVRSRGPPGSPARISVGPQSYIRTGKWEASRRSPTCFKHWSCVSAQSRTPPYRPKSGVCSFGPCRTLAVIGAGPLPEYTMSLVSPGSLVGGRPLLHLRL
ncbi:hypothetical protein NDU88_004621 [Pleurodeles waltl]|uniref:Uncharacterized protein n=1 Tax=Pleurodeles waltl TaxID=8319 RepID=A0AAV7TUU1_PLEWA|nr:hypothetical protein NDU88_004621 [Pleurodeles waltl]